MSEFCNRMYNYHICILAPVHPYDDVRVFQKEAVSLAQWKYRVTLYARGKSNVSINNIQIKVLPTYRKRIFRFLNIPKVFWYALNEKADFYHLHNPDTLPIGFALKLMGKKVIYDTHEDFTQRIFSRNWIPPLFRRLLAFLIDISEHTAGLLFDAVIVTQSQVQSRIGRKAVLIGNPAIAQGKLIDKAYAYRKLIQKDDFFRVLYVGAISYSRGLMEMVRAIGILNRKIFARLWLIGQVDTNDLRGATQDNAWGYVDYLGQISQEQAFAYMLKSDAGLVTILDIADHKNTSANKIYEYQRVALPFVASSFQKWRDQLEPVGSGLFVDPTNPEEIANALYRIATNPGDAKKMGQLGQKFILEKYNWETESKKLLNLYVNLRG